MWHSNNDMKKQKKINPPWLPGKLLNLIVNKDESYSVIGDFDEEYFERIEEFGIRKARLWYWIQMFRSFPLIIKDSFYWGFAMFNNYLKIAYRNLLKSKGFSFINIIGLALGMALSIMIYSFIENEISYDQFHEKADRIYRARLHAKLAESEFNLANSPAVLAETLLNEFPEVESTFRISRVREIYFRHEEDIIKETNFYFADSNMAGIFTLNLLLGDPATALIRPNSIIITKEMSEKYFGGENPINRSLVTNEGTEYTVTGVADPYPTNSHFKFNFIASMSTINSTLSPYWLGNEAYTYVLLKEETVIENLKEKLPGVVKAHAGPQMKAMMGVSFDDFEASGSFFKIEVQALTDIHLTSGIENEFEAGGNTTNIYIFSIIGSVILLLGCINFINLSTARTSIRTKEIGVRKVLGSQKIQLIKQFLTESIILSTISFLIALLLILLLYPVFIDLASRTIELNLWNNPAKLLIVFLGSITIGFISGIYPSLLFSSFNTINTIKGRLNPGTGVSRLRSVLVVFQFSITIILVASTLIIHNQLDYIKNKDLGYNDEQVLVISGISSLGKQTESFKNEVLKNNNVINASVSRSLPGRNLSATIFKCEEHDINLNYAFALFPTDYDYVNTFGTRIIAGRYFSKEFSTDSNSVVLNETAVKEFGLSDPLGKQILHPSDEPGEYNRLNIIGVMNDFHVETLRGEIHPVVFSLIRDEDNEFLSLKLKSEDAKESIAALESLWAEFSPDKPFEYFFMDEDFDKYYKEDIKTGKLFTAFSALAVFIACLGLLGLISYTAERRTKEIGIRKTLGASLPSILILLSKDFSLWILIANVIAVPVVYYFMSGWLEEFAFRISINPLTFVIAGIATILIALLTAAYQTLKAALINPVESLRDE